MEDRFSAGKKVAALGIAINILLSRFRLTAGYAAGSQAMIADGLNSLGDVFASTVTLLGSLYAAKPKRCRSRLGTRQRRTYIASMIIGFSMIVMAIYTISGSVDSLMTRASLEFSWWLVGVAAANDRSQSVLICFLYQKEQAIPERADQGERAGSQERCFRNIGKRWPLFS